MDTGGAQIGEAVQSGPGLKKEFVIHYLPSRSFYVSKNS